MALDDNRVSAFSTTHDSNQTISREKNNSLLKTIIPCMSGVPGWIPLIMLIIVLSYEYFRKKQIRKEYFHQLRLI